MRAEPGLQNASLTYKPLRRVLIDTMGSADGGDIETSDKMLQVIMLRRRLGSDL